MIIMIYFDMSFHVIITQKSMSSQKHIQKKENSKEFHLFLPRFIFNSITWIYMYQCI